jgi:hypothetical protein
MQHYVPEDRTLHNHCCENPQSCNPLCLYITPTLEMKHQMHSPVTCVSGVARCYQQTRHTTTPLREKHCLRSNNTTTKKNAIAPHSYRKPAGTRAVTHLAPQHASTTLNKRHVGHNQKIKKNSRIPTQLSLGTYHYHHPSF